MRTYSLIVVALLSACSNLPPAIEDPPAYDLGYFEVITNPAKYKNAPVRWGGTIIEVENEASFSAIQVLLYPLGSYGYPDLDEANQGRFILKSVEFLDPAVYKKNLSITVAGIIDGDTERKVGNKTLKLPVVTAKQIHIWEEPDNSVYYGGYRGYGGFGYGGGYGGFYFPYGGYYGYGPYNNFGGGYYQPFYPHRHR
jgi:outer membrane lipoprotein